ncbi:MAG: MFS transporter, partial [Polyangiaceae bacterium]
MVAGAPSVERELALSHRAYATVVFSVPLVLAAAIEGAVAYVSDRADRRRLVVAGQAGLATALLVAACTRSPAGLALALTLAGAASGIACNAAQAQLVEGDPARADRAMVRWTLLSCVGDVLAPVVTAAAIALGSSYRGAMAVVGALVAGQCVVTALFHAKTATAAGPAGDGAERAHDEPSPRGSPRLWAWLFAAASCTLLDEIVVALAALRMEREQGEREAIATAVAVAFSLGAVAGSAWAERAVERWGARAVLGASAAATVLALGAYSMTGGVVGASLALLLLGLACAPQHGLALAQAYQVLPGSPGRVQALAQVFVVVDVGAPFVIGLAADRLGPGRAIELLAIQPLVVLACVVSAGRGRDRV